MKPALPFQRRLRPRSGRSGASVALAFAGWLAGGIPIAQAEPGYAGLGLADAIGRLHDATGLEVLYSDELVTPALRVGEEPRAHSPRQLLDELLSPHGLASRQLASGRLVVTRTSKRIEPAHPAPRTDEPAASTPIPEVVVTASRYVLANQLEPSFTTLQGTDVQTLPDLGDDPLRAVARLPGVTSNGLSSKLNLRGGEASEVLVRFDGLRLYDPYHLKDFQSVFSTVDPALVHSLDVYTGGFPVWYGDRMSGVVDVQSVATPATPMRAVTAGLFSAGVLAADRFNDARSEWLVSGRRGNLDLTLDAFGAKRGEPRYHDLHARVGHRFSERLAIRASALRAYDDLEISDPDQEENATATYEDDYLWLSVDWLPGASLASRTTVGSIALDAHRSGTADQPGISIGTLDETQRSDILFAYTDWRWDATDGLLLAFGGEVSHLDGHYTYQDDVRFDLLFDTPGAPTDTTRTRSLRADPEGSHLAAYAALKADITASLSADIGLRWSRNTLTPGQDDSVDPRAALLWRLGSATELRLSAGRFSQSQALDELQLNDGVTVYHPAQEATHLVGSVRHQLRPGLALRTEIYEKRYRDLYPRFENLLNAFVILPELKPDRVRIDAREAKARGVELSLQADHDSFDWWATYAWGSARDEAPDGQTRRSWDQSHALGAGIAWSSPRWDVSLAATWHTGWPTTAVSLAATEPQPLAATGPRNGERFDDYASIDLRVARRFPLETGLLTVFLELTNLTNRNNPCCTEYEYNTEEDVPFLETEVHDSLPVLPNLGVTWEF